MNTDADFMKGEPKTSRITMVMKEEKPRPMNCAEPQGAEWLPITQSVVWSEKQVPAPPALNQREHKKSAEMEVLRCDLPIRDTRRDKRSANKRKHGTRNKRGKKFANDSRSNKGQCNRVKSGYSCST